MDTRAYPISNAFMREALSRTHAPTRASVTRGRSNGSAYETPAVVKADRPAGGAWQYSFMGSRGKLASTVASIAFVALALSGCIAAGSGFAVLDRDAEPEDVLPSGLPDFSDEDVEPSSSRFVSEHDGDELYLAKSTK